MHADEMKASKLLERTYEGFRPLADKLDALDRRLREACTSDNTAIATKARQLQRKIREFEPSVTMIGQVKAGKTTLVNAMTGDRSLLPADVNPWTSVVTSLHLQPGSRRATMNASFKFFTEEEWSHLITRGGRMGELANRAGAHDELEKVRTQLEQMRDKSRERLGRRFEMLLGQSHDYESFDAELVERYVCLGDNFWDEAGSDRAQGRFADITRTADLWLTQSEMPVGLCICDTPGVNDTFMIREQITINALRGSRLCVMVLAATQALTSVDLALIRMISNVKSRDVIIFVNRIDELADPAREIPQIHASIQETLRKHDGPSDVEIIFGCGFWASQALAGDITDLQQDSAKALLNWAEANLAEQAPHDTVEEMIWSLSGMYALGRAITARIENGAGAQILRAIEVEIDNLDQSIAAADAIMASTEHAGGGCRMSSDELTNALAEIESNAHSRLMTSLAPLQHSLVERIENSRRTFVSRATAALLKHLELYGELEVWTYDPCGLRVLLRSSFQRYVQAVTKHGNESMAAAATDITKLYREAFDLNGIQPTLEPPPLPIPDAPVVLGQTIALDLRGTWWSRFWRRRHGYKGCADDFAQLIREETQTMLDTLVSENAQGFEAAVFTALAEFMSANRKIMLGLVNGQARGLVSKALVGPAGHGVVQTPPPAMRPNLEVAK